MKICVVGHTGFVGQAVYNNLLNKHEVFKLNTKTNIPTQEFDITINCAGNSKKYLAQTYPFQVNLIENNVINSILKLKTKKIIHISSIEASSSLNNNYAISKLNTEKAIISHFPEAIILRLGGLVGPNLRKNVVFDIVNNKKLFVTLDSTYNYISSQEVARIIEVIIDKNIKNNTINICSCNTITVQEIINEASKYSLYFTNESGIKKETYKNIDISKLKKIFLPKNSKYYINNYLRNYAINQNYSTI